MLLLTADTDPNTPTGNAQRLLDGIPAGAALVRQDGGPHVLYGRGEPCVDDLVTEMVTSGELPGRGPRCPPGSIADYYLHIPPALPEEYTDPSIPWA